MPVGSVFVISLADSHARRQHMAAVLSACGISFQFFDAIDGRGCDPLSLSHLYSESAAIQVLGYPMLGSQVATVLSHLSLYKHILASKLPWALILEDDIRIVRPIVPILDHISLLPSEWDVVKLCYYRNSNTLRHYVMAARGRRAFVRRYRLGFFTENMHSCAAYLISRKGAARMVEILEQGFCEPIDHYTGNITTHQLYGVIPKPVEIDLRLGLAGSVAGERAAASLEDSRQSTLRTLLRRFRLFPLAKKLNLARLEIQKPITHIYYMLTHPWLLLHRPPHNR